MMGCCGVEEERTVGRRDEAVRAKGERDGWRCMARVCCGKVPSVQDGTI